MFCEGASRQAAYRRAVALAFGHATALRVKRITRASPQAEQRAIERAAVFMPPAQAPNGEV